MTSGREDQLDRAEHPISAVQTLTGERTLPHIWHENYWFRRHEAVYVYLSALLGVGSAGRVLDAGCGEGYGSALLARSGAHQVVGLDYDLPTLEHLSVAYQEVTPLKANLVALPFPDQAFDAVISLQVIEHIWEQPRFVSECARVARSGGWIALSTPNRLTFSPGVGRREKPLNPFHINEFDAEELSDLLPPGLIQTSLLGLHHGPRLRGWEQKNGSVVTAQLAQPYASWSESLTNVVSALTSDDFVLSADGIDQSLDLVVTAQRE